MTLKECIAKIDELKPNEYLESAKIDWINEVEGIVLEGIINKAKENPESFVPYTEDDLDKELKVEEPYSELYLKYVFAQIDFNNAEIQRYNNSVSMYNASYQRYASYYRRNHMPVQRYKIRNYG